MQPDGNRTKKLILAFHFHQSDQAGWKCEDCRKSGLERSRRCGFLPLVQEPARIVWARKRVATDQCPKSEVTAQSLEWLEKFFVWKRLGAAYPETPGARDVEAFLLLEQELEREREGNYG